MFGSKIDNKIAMLRFEHEHPEIISVAKFLRLMNHSFSANKLKSNQIRPEYFRKVQSYIDDFSADRFIWRFKDILYCERESQ